MMEERSCTGATAGLSGKELAGFRLLKKDGLTYRAMEMNLEELSERRIYLRKALKDYPRWENLTNDELNDICLSATESGFLLEDGEGHEIFLPAAGITSGEAEYRKIRAMMPFEFINPDGKDFRWDRYKADTTSEKNLVNSYITRYQEFRNSGMGLYIYSGTKGSGKTMLSCCLLNEIAKRYAGSVKFVNILDFLEMTKKGFNGEEEDVRAVYRAGLLVLDDIGVQMSSKEWIDTVLYRLVNERYVNRLPTVYTSNIPIEHLKINDRITDRIESATFFVKLPEEAVRRSIMRQEKQKLLEKINGSPWGSSTAEK